jgi:hypothetical protein
MRILNKRPVERTFSVAVEGLPGARIEVAGAVVGDPQAGVKVPADHAHEVRVLVFGAGGAHHDKSVPITFRIADIASGETAEAGDYFRVP